MRKRLSDLSQKTVHLEQKLAQEKLKAVELRNKLIDMTKETGIGIGLLRGNKLEKMNGKCHDCDKVLSDNEIKTSEAQGTLEDTYCSVCIMKEDWTEEEFAHYEQDVNNLLEKHQNDTFIQSKRDDIQAKKI